MNANTLKPAEISANVPGLSATSELGSESIRQMITALTERDGAINDAVGKIIEYLKQATVAGPVVIPAVLVPAGKIYSVANVRIPVGWQGRIINAQISPDQEEAVVLRILHSTDTFGQLSAISATTVVETGSEFSSGSEFYGQGEFIIQFENIVAISSTAVASILVEISKS